MDLGDLDATATLARAEGELAIALQLGVISLRNQAGQALDLRHRLPLLWAAVRELRVEPWVPEGRRDVPSPDPRPGRGCRCCGVGGDR